MTIDWNDGTAIVFYMCVCVKHAQQIYTWSKHFDNAVFSSPVSIISLWIRVRTGEMSAHFDISPIIIIGTRSGAKKLSAAVEVATAATY